MSVLKNYITYLLIRWLPHKVAAALHLCRLDLLRGVYSSSVLLLFPVRFIQPHCLFVGLGIHPPAQLFRLLGILFFFSLIKQPSKANSDVVGIVAAAKGVSLPKTA